jgi:GntR family transcriptional regulator
MAAESVSRWRVRANVQTSRRRVHDMLRAGITAGVIDKPLVEDELKTTLWTSRNSVRGALQMLAEEGLVSRRPKHGTNVVRRIVSVPLWDLFPRSSSQPGQARVRVQLLETRTVPVNCVIADRLMSTEHSVILFEQLVFIDDEPVSVHTSYVVTELSPAQVVERLRIVHATDRADAAIFEEFFGERLAEVEIKIEAIPGDEATCRLLGIPTGAPVLFRESLRRDVHGRPRALVYAHHRGDRIALSTTTGATIREHGCRWPDVPLYVGSTEMATPA